MVNTSKILTVSYGTFSCTLEGFDDSFETMKAIAEYFRDLAADDRYFGAEPPTPDAEMLARIAEREISRRVEAREEEGKIVLRAGDLAMPAALAGAAAVDDAVEKVTQEAEADLPEAEAEALAPDLAPDDVTDATEDTVTEGNDEASETLAGESEEIARMRAALEAEFAEKQAALEAELADKAAALEAAQAEVAEARDSDEAEAADATVEAHTAESGEDAAPQTADAPPVEDRVEETETPEVATVPEAPGEKPGEEPVLEAAEIVEPEAPVAEVDAPAEEPAPAPDSIAAKLRRIRSVVAQDAEEEYSEDEHAQDVLASEEDTTEGAAEETGDAETEADAPAETVEAEAAEEAEDQATDDTLAALLADVAEDSPPEVEAEDAPQTDGAEVNTDALAALLADETPEETAQETAQAADTVAEAPVQEAPEAPAEETARAQAPEADAQEVDAPTEAPAATLAPVAPQKPVVARVMKMKRADLEKAIAEGRFEEEVDEDDSTDDWDMFADSGEAAEGEDVIDSILSPEDEAELQRELAAVEAEFGGTADTIAPATPEAEIAHAEEFAAEAEAAPEVQDTAAEAAPVAETETEAHNEADAPAAAPLVLREDQKRGRDKLEQAASSDELGRIFEKADQQLDAPENNQRRNAIAHLRAAVAATKAEKNAGRALTEDVDDAPYRTDLQSVVRPRRPRPVAQGATPRPEEVSAPAPLKLVAEQRVDLDQAPVQPRRVSSEAFGADDGEDRSEVARMAGYDSFADYAAEMDALDLPDLLEAAASYLTFVETRSEFSRPMLMQKVAEVQADRFSREESLRAFGKLLRDGKLTRVRGGRFTASEEIDYQPKRAVG